MWKNLFVAKTSSHELCLPTLITLLTNLRHSTMRVSGIVTLLLAFLYLVRPGNNEYISRFSLAIITAVGFMLGAFCSALAGATYEPHATHEPHATDQPTQPTQPTIDR